jgi:Na+/glutamate symporter
MQGDPMSLWQRLVVTLVAMFIASYLAGLIWQALFSVTLPSYAGGMVGGLAAIPVWELLKQVSPKRQGRNDSS